MRGRLTSHDLPSRAARSEQISSSFRFDGACYAQAMPAEVRRIGLIGDIHAEDQLLERALELLAGRALDAILATGDIADGAGSVNRC